MAVKSVIILTAGFGEGHNAAARNLRDAFQELNPDIRVEVHDVFADAYGWINRVLVVTYLAVINHFPTLWELVFQWLDRSTALRDGVGFLGVAVRRLRELLARARPEVVVTTYPGYVHLLDHLAGIDGGCEYVTLVTDSLSVNSVWYSERTAGYIVANEETAAVMERAGVPRGQLHVLGFPVPAIFARMNEAKRPPLPGGRWKVLFMVNSGKRIALEAVRELVKVDGIDLVVTVGRDDVLKRKIRAIVAGRDHVRVFGWTDELPKLMAEAHVVVTKAGGATVQECLAARTPLIVSQVVPGQEEGNARLVLRAGAGDVAETAEGIATAVREMISADGRQWRAWSDAVARLSRPDAAREIAQWIAGKFPSEHASGQEKG